jgi:hypothetical protein
VALERLTLGHTLPRRASVASVELDGERVGYSERLTNRGLEILVRAPVDGEAHVLRLISG